MTLKGNYPLLRSSLAGLLGRVNRNMDVAADLVSDKAAAAAKRHAPQKTGELRASIKPCRKGSFASGNLVAGAIAEAPHALAQEFGSGIHGEKKQPYPIVPKFRKALRFPTGNGFGFAKKVMHPGVRAQPYMEPAREEALDVAEKVVLDAIEDALFG